MNTTKQLYQWDINQMLVDCTGLYVDFPVNGEIYRVETKDGECLIPDEFIQAGGRQKIWECMPDCTRKEFVLEIKARPMPPDYAFTPTEKLTFDGLAKRVDDAIADMIRMADSGKFDGYTPVKGKDYFTADEIKQIQDEVSSGAVGDFKSVVDAETETFNINAETKLNEFNVNAESNLTEYNGNATEKLNAYNSNAEIKVTEYNQNDTNKTAEYNSNAETKMDEYNTNANNRVDEFDSHTEQIQTDISELKSDLSNKLQKSPVDWEQWTAEEQAAARARMGAYHIDLIGTVETEEEVKSISFDFEARSADRIITIIEMPIVSIAKPMNIRITTSKGIALIVQFSSADQSTSQARCFLSDTILLDRIFVSHNGTKSTNFSVLSGTASVVISDRIDKTSIKNVSINNPVPMPIGTKVSLYMGA